MGKTKIGVIGLGAMGLGMARSLVRGGFDVHGFDVSPDAAGSLVSSGGTAAATPRAAAEDADVVFCVVVNADQVDAVLFGADGAAAVLPSGAVFAVCSTVPAAFAVDAARRLAPTGAHYLDAPISGGAAKAADGQLTVMASGSKAAFTAAGPALDAVAQTVYRLGDEPGAGSTMKMINQLLAGVHIAAAAEAMALAARQGLDLRQVYDIIVKAAGNSWMFENRVPHILEGDYTPRSAVDIFVKDLGIVLEAGKTSRFPLPLSAAAHQMFLAASAAGMGRWDDAAVAKVYQRLSDIDLPGDKP
ncbi:MAG: L-threonate dehydrogenase [Inquilinaceae bacterium]